VMFLNVVTQRVSKQARRATKIKLIATHHIRRNPITIIATDCGDKQIPF
jgi:hypothetical protein